MSSVFVSHASEDSAVALQIAFGLEEQGYTTWCYELDSIPGPSHMAQTMEAIEKCDAVVMLISPNCVHSHEMTTELTRAQDQGKSIIPLLHDITHEELMRQRAEWGERLGTATSLDVGRDASTSIRRLVRGLEFFNVKPAEAHAAKEDRLRLIEEELTQHGGRIYRGPPKTEAEPGGGAGGAAAAEPGQPADQAMHGSKVRVFPGDARRLAEVSEFVDRLLAGEGLQTQVLSEGDDGRVVQGRERPQQSWKKVLKTTLGLVSAVSVTLVPEGSDLKVTIGASKWMDKAIGGAIGALVFWPAAVTAGYGVYKQWQLFTRIERDIATFLAAKR